MDIEFFSSLAHEFRKALETVRDKRQYGRLTIFGHFPDGCCRYSSDLFAEYLMDKGIAMERIQLADGESNEERYTHCWLVIDNVLVVDITADQFNGKPYFKKYEPIPSCYIMTRDTAYLHECFENPKMRYSRYIGISSYSGDISAKLQVVYDAVIRQIEINAKRR